MYRGANRRIGEAQACFEFGVRSAEGAVMTISSAVAQALRGG